MSHGSSFHGSCHGNRKPVPASSGSKTKLRGGGREGKGGLAGVESEPSQEEARVKLVGLNRSKS